MKKYYYVALIIFFLALILRVITVIDMQAPTKGDPLSYDTLARSIIDRLEFSYVHGKPISWRPPLYPLFLAIIYSIGKYSYLLVGIFQAVIGSLTCVFIYWIAREFFVQTVAVIGGLISACYLYFVVSTKFLMSEVLFIFLFTFSIYYFIKGLRRSFLFRDIALAGFLLGLATLTRSITLLLPIFIFIFIFLSRRANLKILIRSFIIALIFFLIPVSIWTTRNYLVHRSFILVSSNGGVNFFVGNTPDENGRYRVRGPSKKEILEIEGNESKLEAAKVSKLYFKKALDYIFKHPKVVARLIVMKFAFFWSPFDWYFFGSKGVYNYHYGFIFPFSLLGIFLCSRRWKEYGLLYLPVCYFTSISLLFHIEPRYRMPIDPFLIIFASYGLFHLFQKYVNKWIPVTITVSFFVANFVIYLYSDNAKEGMRYIFHVMGLW